MIEPSIPVFDFPDQLEPRPGAGEQDRRGAGAARLPQSAGADRPDSCCRWAWSQPVLDSLREAGIDYTICDAVNYEPTVALFDSIVAELDLRGSTPSWRWAAAACWMWPRAWP